MGDIYLTPKDEGEAVELSSTLFRKKILPKGTIDYKGRKIVFDDDYLTDLATAYKDGAYDQVPFMLADKDNAHTMDPERFRGEIKGVEVADDGLWGTFELSADAAQLVKQNPKLGVSARIVEGYSRSDGKTYGRAMQHVLGTLDPRIPGLGAWEEVALSGYDSSDEVVDLTGAQFEGEDTVAKPDDTEGVEELTDEEFAALLAELGLDEEGEPAGDDNAQPAAVPAGAGAGSDTKLANEVEATKTAIQLANEQIAQLKADKAAQMFEADKRDYVRRGVPPALVELARPVLEAPDGAVLDFSNGVETKKVDAAAVVRQMLDSTAGYIELAQERGHSVDFSQAATDKKQADEEAELLSAWAKQAGDNA